MQLIYICICISGERDWRGERGRGERDWEKGRERQARQGREWRETNHICISNTP